MIHRATGIAVSLLAMSLAVPQNASGNADTARRAARTAEVLIDRSDYESAVQSLSGIDCRGDHACQLLIDFSYGWVYESWATATPERQDQLFAESLGYYERALERNPENIQILTNLALAAQGAGKPSRAVEIARRAIKQNPEGAFDLYLFLGDVRASTDDGKGALRDYKSAVNLNPANPAGHLRLLEFYRKAGLEKELLNHSRQVRQALPAVAALGFEYYIHATYAELPKRAEAALVPWTAVRADLGSLTAVNLESLPDPGTWNSRGLVQLTEVVLRNDAPPASAAIDWWLKTPERRDGISRVLRLKAARLSAGADASGEQRTSALHTAIRYLSAAVKLAPEYHAYFDGPLKKLSNAKIDAATDLVALHHSLKAGADPQGLSGISTGELEEMTSVLFSGKAGAYATGQLSAIQRYHTVLGLIYYELGRWSSDWADNATFQLSHALETADKVARKNPEKYEPLPELKALLAEVYLKRGLKAESARTSLAAAMSFLETDNLRAAGQSLASARNAGADNQKMADVQRILAGRQAVTTKGAELLQHDPETETVRLSAEIEWLKDPEKLKLPRRFVNGQRFKILADLGTKLETGNNDNLTRYVNAMALDAASKQKTLTSPSDLKRLRNIEKNLFKSVQKPHTSPTLTVGTTTPGTGDQRRWSLPTSTGNLVIQIDKQTLDEGRNLIEQNRIQAEKKFHNMKGKYPLGTPRLQQ